MSTALFMFLWKQKLNHQSPISAKLYEVLFENGQKIRRENQLLNW